MKSLLVVSLYLLSAFAYGWTLEVSTGTSFKIPNTITISQEGFADYLVTDATYETRPWTNFSSLPGLTENYYSVRIGNSLGDYIYEIEWIHDKTYYVSGNDPDNAIRHFELSDGHNLALFNVGRVYALSDSLDAVARVGFGLSIPNPATDIRGQQDGTRTHLAPGSAYYITGPAAQVAGQLRYYLTDSFALTAEGKYTFSNSLTPISGGFAGADFHAIHINFGVLFSLGGGMEYTQR